VNDTDERCYPLTEKVHRCGNGVHILACSPKAHS
jgi:hypothetical protein